MFLGKKEKEVVINKILNTSIIVLYSVGSLSNWNHFLVQNYTRILFWVSTQHSNEFCCMKKSLLLFELHVQVS